MTTTTQTLEATKIWYKMSPMERYQKVIKNIPIKKLKGINGFRLCIKYIVENNIN